MYLFTVEDIIVNDIELLSVHSGIVYPRQFCCLVCMRYDAVIGLELHTRIRSLTKLFSYAPAVFNAAPNTNITLFDAAIPGSMPRLNASCVELGVKAALALGMNISRRSTFDRKHYFYADIPAGYQITQYHSPLAKGGSVTLAKLDGLETPLRVRIKQLQLEQDTAASYHDMHPDSTLVDLNRVGTGLMEIVTEPDMRSAKEAMTLVKKVQQLMRAVGASDGNMDEGSLRCDVNVSVRKKGETDYGVRCEIKNLNSLKSMQGAIDSEISRHVDLLESGGTVASETRGYDVSTGQTFLLRRKEDTPDYRYMPDGDIPPLILSQATVNRLLQTLPELPDAQRDRLLSHGLNAKDVHALMTSDAVDFYQQALDMAGHARAKHVCNWIVHELFGRLNTRGIELVQSPVSSRDIADLVNAVEENHITGKSAKSILETKVEGDKRPVPELIEALGLRILSDDSALADLCAKVITSNPTQVQQYREGNHNVLQFLIGQAMKASRGKADPKRVQKVLMSQL